MDTSVTEDVKVEYTTNSLGQAVKVTTVTKKIPKVVKINKNVLERSKLPKFGACAGQGAGPENSVTTIANDEIEIRCQPAKQEESVEKSEVDRIAESKTMVVLCHHCGEYGHFFLKCPKRREIDAGADKGRDNKFSHSDEAPEFTVKLSNISEAATDYAVRNLVEAACADAGINRPSRTFLVKDKITMRSRGFAFIAFSQEDDANRAVEALDGHGYDSLILQAEIAAPREERPRRTEGGEDRPAPAPRPWRH